MNYNDPTITKLKKIYDKVIYMKMYNQVIIYHEGKELRINEDIIQTLDMINQLDKTHLMTSNISTNANVQKILDMK